MLAMCDLNQSGDIDGNEVFGDRTRNPFLRGNPLINASNGFEALYIVAKTAFRQFSGIRLFNIENGDTLVHLPTLKQALRRVGCNLGFIGDENISHLESLRDVVWVKVTGYESNPNDVKDGVSFIQKSWYSDTNGRRWGVDDVWFPSSL